MAASLGPIPTPPQTFLQIVSACDNYRLNAPDTDPVVPWLLAPTRAAAAVGLLRPEVVAQLRAEAAAATAAGAPPSWVFSDSHPSPAAGHKTEWVSFAPHLATPAARSRVMAELCERWRDTGLWPDEVGPRKWRAEVYPVYRNPFGARDYPAGADADADDTNFAFEMERAASGLFGIVTYGVHMSVVVADPGSVEGWKMWVARRAATKQTWPGYLDNSVAGGIPAGYAVYETVVKEAMEEGSIPEDVVRKYTTSVGTVSYFFRTPRGWLQPEVEYVYDLRLPVDSDVVPKPMDGEVDSFELLPMSKVAELIKTGMFKYNCSIVIIDLMIRQGFITPDNEPDYQEIVTRLHGRFEYERWSQV
ncbi:nudix hydrolase 20 [Epithele typhae]|uniref:nudix hydrolase 20 n=1 Tax=Epithele typhae TaxID=378194 RepID=UPI00200814E0|nr:nudix hydrolase 20 [Epithele typhae]KAH9927950.1 nudix hydrolase 20 [Epithele typhae]